MATREEITLSELKKALKNISKEVDDVVSKETRKTYKGPLKQKRSERTIRFKKGRRIFKDRIYVNLTREFANSWSRNLFIHDLKIKLEDEAEDRSLMLGRKVRRKIDTWFELVEIRNCGFIRDAGYGPFSPLIINFRNFREVNFIDNELLDTTAEFQVSEETWPITIQNNKFYTLTIRYFDVYIIEFIRQAPWYSESVIENNKVFSFLHIDISRDSGGKMEISLINNKIEALALSYTRKEEEEKKNKKRKVKGKRKKKEEEKEKFAQSPDDYTPHLFRDILRHQALKDEYPGSHKLILSSGNDIEEIYMTGRYPRIVMWGLNERVGDSLKKRYREKSRKTGFRSVMSLPLSWLGYEKPYENDITISKSDATARIEANRYILGFLRKIAIDQNQKVLEQVMNYNITKMDGMLLEINDGPWKDRLLSLANWWLSKHGTSWISPIAFTLVGGILSAAIVTIALEAGCVGGRYFFATKFALALGEDAIIFRNFFVIIVASLLGCLAAVRGLFFANILTKLRRSNFSKSACLLFLTTVIWIMGEWIGGDTVRYWAVLFELMHPLGHPNNILDEIPVGADELIWYSLPIFGVVFFSFKALYAICIYMFFRAATRFTIKPKH